MKMKIRLNSQFNHHFYPICVTCVIHFKERIIYSIMNFDLILAHIAKHIQLDEEEKNYFISLLQHKSIKRKEFLLTQGKVCRTENFITKGCVRMYTIDESGAEHIVMFGMEDWWVGDLYSFLTQTPATYFIDALEDTELWQISKVNLDQTV